MPIDIKDVQTKFEYYVKYISPEFQVNSHHKLFFDNVQDIIDKKIRFLMLSVPPRHTKSMTFSELLPPFYFGNFPNKRIIHISYDQGLVEGFGVRIRETINSPDYKDLFPNTNIAGRGTTGRQFRIKGGVGEYKARSTNSGITGNGADLLIIDDILKDSKDAMSKERRKQMKDLWISTVNSRLQPGGQVIIVSTRWHEDDLVGWLRRVEPQNKWRYINIPALCINPATDPLGRTEVDQAIWESWRSAQELIEMRNANKGQFACVYQGTPIVESGTVFDGFKKYSYAQPIEVKEKRVEVVSYDTASSKDEEADYSVITKWALSDNLEEMYLVDYERERWDIKELIDKAKEIERKCQPAVTLIEKASSGIQLGQFLEGEKHWGSEIRVVIPSRKAEAKLTKAMSVAPLLKEGVIWLLDDDYIKKELQEFPVGVYDDFIDSMGLGVSWVYNNRLDYHDIRKLWKRRVCRDGRTRKPIMGGASLNSRSRIKSIKWV